MKLVTWNIQWCRGCDGRVDPGRIVDHALALADFDVLCLQEVSDNFPGLEGSSGENQFRELAQLLPGYEAVAGVAVDVPAEGARRRRFGNMILSRLPVLRVLRHQLPWPPDPGSRPGMSRLLLEAVLRSPLGDFRVMTTHLEYYSALQRAAQVEAIRRVHQQSCAQAKADGLGAPGAATSAEAAAASRARRDKPGTPFAWHPQPASAILTGDFNFKPDDPLHHRMQAPFGDDTPLLHDSWTGAHPGIPHQDTNGVHDRIQWPGAYPCDFIYVTTDLLPRIWQVRVDAQTQASDHQPVLIELA